MQKKVVISLFIFGVSSLLFFYAYTHRSVALFLCATSLLLVIVAVLIEKFRDGFIVAISIVFSMAMMEGALGYIKKISAKNLDINTRSAYFDADQQYNTPAYWQLTQFGSQPRQGEFRAKKLASDGGIIYDVKYQIGPDGFRVTPEFEGISRNRINFLGDSFTFGEGVEGRETMAYFYGALARDSGNNVQVKNLGMSGGGVHQALAILESQLSVGANSHFLLTAPWHSSRAACADNFSLGSPRYRIDNQGLVERSGYCRSFSWVENAPKALRGLITSSHIFNLIQDNFFVISDQDKQIELYLAILKKISKQLVIKNENLVIGYIKADENWFTGSFNNEKIISKIREMDIKTIDMTLAKRNEDLAQEFYLHELDKHPTAKANLERARLLITEMRR